MHIDINWGYLLAAAFGVAGVIEYVKGFAKTAPGWVWHVLLPLICIGVAVAGDGGAWQIATNAVLILAVAQLCYDLVIASVRKLLAKLSGEPETAAPGDPSATGTPEASTGTSRFWPPTGTKG